MPIVVLLALAVAISLLQQPIWQASFAGANFAPLSVGLYLAVSVGLAAANARISHRLAGGGSTSSPRCLPPKAIKRHNLFALAGAAWMVAGLAAAMTMGYRADHPGRAASPAAFR